MRFDGSVAPLVDLAGVSGGRVYSVKSGPSTLRDSMTFPGVPSEQEPCPKELLAPGKCHADRAPIPNFHCASHTYGNRKNRRG